MAGAPERPEEVTVHRGGSSHSGPVGEHDARREDVVSQQAMLPLKPTVTPAQHRRNNTGAVARCSD